MMTSIKGGTRGYILTALVAAGAMPSDGVAARPAELGYQSSASSPVVPASDGGPRVGRWLVQADAQLATVAAGNGEDGIFLGVQCDPFEPSAHRMVLGVRNDAIAPEMRTLLRGMTRKIVITAKEQAITATFETAPEDRGQTNFAGNAQYVAAHLSASQLDAIASARTLSVQVGLKTYQFSGYGSGLALAAMSCKAKPIHVASRLIERNRKPIAPAPRQTWQVRYHAGTAALIKGTMDASVSSTASYLNSETTFRLGVACLGSQLYARVEANFAPLVRDENDIERTAKSIAKFTGSAKQVEVYRRNQRLTTIAISKAEMAGLGHALSALDIANLMEADSLVVSSGNNTVEFPASGSSAALNKVFRTCSING